MQNLRGIGLILFAMAAFSVEDALIKVLTGTLPIGQVMLSIGLGGALVFLIAAGPRAVIRALVVPQVAIRTLTEAVGAVTFVTALSLIPLSTVAAVFQATPLAVTAGAALFFAERVGWRRWSAVLVGFFGVMLIIRPGFAGFQPEIILVLITVIAIASRDLITRRVPDHIPSVAISFHAFLAVALSGAVLLASGATPVATNSMVWLRIGLAVMCGASGYYAIVAAMRHADASALMPFRYSRLVFSLMIGVAVFAERPDALTLAGAAIILAAGFYTYWRERRLSLVIAVA